jgi:Ser/Thr protein kinase RdoA (MazF antagonist)
VGSLLRDFHDASAEFTPPEDPRWNVVINPDARDLIVHQDTAPWNLVCSPGRWVLLDWDNAGPGSRMWDLAHAAHGFVPLAPGTPLGVAARRIVALADGYGLDAHGRSGLADLLHRRVMSRYDHLQHGHRTGAQPWSRLWAEGHGDVWAANAEYVRQNIDTLRRALANDDGETRLGRE